MKPSVPIAGPDGTVYPSSSKAAKALGVSRATLKRHLEMFGTLENLGALTGTRVPVRGPDGTVHASKADAARALGVDVATISRHLDEYGNLDFIGTATVPCVWRGKTYPSINAAAGAIGVAPHVVSYHLGKYGNLDRAGWGNHRPFGNDRTAKPFALGPLEFGSVRKAAKALGISEHTLHRMKSPRATPASRERLMAMAMALRAKQACANRHKEEAF